MEQNKEIKNGKPLINAKDKLHREYNKSECEPLPKGIMPETKTSHDRLAYLDKSVANAPLYHLKEMWNKK